jgi:hypothetical protein
VARNDCGYLCLRELDEPDLNISTTKENFDILDVIGQYKHETCLKHNFADIGGIVDRHCLNLLFYVSVFIVCYCSISCL